MYKNMRSSSIVNEAIKTLFCLFFGNEKILSEKKVVEAKTNNFSLMNFCVLVLLFSIHLFLFR